MIPKVLTTQIGSAIMKMELAEENRIESSLEISTYLARLKYALSSNHVKIQFLQDRKLDNLRDEKYTNRFTVADLFPKEDPVVALHRELASLGVENYVETVKDKRYPKRSEMRVFGKTYFDDQVYIKIRVELIKPSSAGIGDHVFIMSFHYAERAFKDSDFQYRKN